MLELLLLGVVAYAILPPTPASSEERNGFDTQKLDELLAQEERD